MHSERPKKDGHGRARSSRRPRPHFRALPTPPKRSGGVNSREHAHQNRLASHEVMCLSKQLKDAGICGDSGGTFRDTTE